ncbi:hypothetical protein B7486_08280 [cyanobacterium TDX16]|nr:hypothetical protein B7486_08280 [cyanobacterium TDX16]
MTTCVLDRPSPFRLPFHAAGRLTGLIVEVARTAIERALSFPSLNGIYHATFEHLSAGPFAERILAAMRIHVDVNEAELRRIPATGPIIVVANHPFGGLDGVILTALLQRIRPDVRLLVNYLLGCIPEMHETSFFVDPFGNPAAQRRNAASMRSAIRWVEGGGLLGVFPAGEVSHLTTKGGCVTDPAWSDTVARIAHRSGATVVPMLFDGRNGTAFQLAGLVHPRLRTALLPHEMISKRGSSVRVTVGQPISARWLGKFLGQSAGAGHLSDADAAKLTEYLRLRTYILRSRVADSMSTRRKSSGAKPSTAFSTPVASALPGEAVAREIAALPPDRCLAQSGSLAVYFASAEEAPTVLREIGRLREYTFRQVGEGTGKEIDLDRFDRYYWQLFAWNQAKGQIVGAYRMGATDRILPQTGVEGLYTHTLFEFRNRLLKQIDPALELGRSFVVPEYQRDFAPLMLLWKGIGRFVAQNPRYRRLFGAVSISDEFHTTTKQLLMAFLKANCFDSGMAECVRPRNPPRMLPLRDIDPRRLAAIVSDMSTVEELVGEIESDGRGVPVLLRQYLKLNAKVLGFNIDPDFGDVLDGLVMIDLTTVSRAVLDRYLGKEGAANFLKHHRSS